MPFEVNVRRTRVTLRHITHQSDGNEIDRKKKKKNLPHTLKLIFENPHIVLVRERGMLRYPFLWTDSQGHRALIGSF